MRAALIIIHSSWHGKTIRIDPRGQIHSCECQQGIDYFLKAIQLVQLLHKPSVDEGHAFEDDFADLKVLQKLFHNVAGLRAVINMNRPRCEKHVRISHRGQRMRASVRSNP